MDAPGRIQRPMVPVGPGRPGLPWDQRSGAVSAPSGDDADVARAGVPLASGIPRWPPGGHRGPRSPDRDPDTAWGGERTAVPSTAVQGTVLVERSDTGRAISERLSLAAAPVEHPFGLSPREDEVLAVLSQGRTNREIAERLYISERTVGVHVRRILAKLGVAGRVEAAGVAIRLGLVPDDLSAADRLADSRRLSARRDK
ncbi:MAG: response regulator transcription factor [Chloroflexi bacterium]|nr:response regulator transcription factor [Chloroflexota bacterium]